MPLEIRMMIYGLVYVTHTIKPAELAPGYPRPMSNTYVTRMIGFHEGAANDSSDLNGEEHEHNGNKRARPPKLLSSSRNITHIPASFLGVNKQIYHEARNIPFNANEFFFVDCFSSGLTTARVFMRSLALWQREALRFARLDLKVASILGGGLTQWRELCQFWAHGLQGLRLRLLNDDGGFGHSDEIDNMDSDLGHDGKTLRFLDQLHFGLTVMTGLHSLEIEMVNLQWSDNKKINWCQKLEETLCNGCQSLGKEKITVVCVETATCSKTEEG